MLQDLTLSIIVPVFNCDKYISRTLDSIFEFTNTLRFECIVVNDGSTDNTSAILKSFQNKIILLEQINSGESSAINSALKVAAGKYSLVLSADDLLITNDLFTSSLEILEKNEEIVATYPDWIMIDSSGRKLLEVQTLDYSQDVMFGEFKCLPGPGSIFRTDIANKIGGRNPRYKLVGDFDFWLRISLEGSLARVPKYLATWRNHEESTTLKNLNHKASDEYIELATNIIADYRFPKKIESSLLTQAHFKAALFSRYDSKVQGRHLLFKALKLGKLKIPHAKISQILFLAFFPLSLKAYKLTNKIFSKLHL